MRWALCLLLCSQVAHADFDPNGRKRGRPGANAPKTPKGAPKPRPSNPNAGAPSTKNTPKTGAPDTPPKAGGATPKPPASGETSTRKPSADPGVDEGSRESANDAVLIQRYKGIVLAQPGAQFPLQRLADLVRKRDGSLDQLQKEFEALAAKPGPGQYAAMVVLGGLYVQANQPDLAVSTFERAVALEPKNPVALKASAHVLQDRGKLKEARATLERALPLLTDDAEREQVLRSLMLLALDSDDVAAAKVSHAQLTKRAKGSLFVEAELGNELLSRGKLAEAEAEFRRVVTLASGDNRALAPALKDLGRALQRQHKSEEATTVLRRALSLTSDQSGVRRELLDLLVDVYRDGERLPEIIALLEKEAGNDFARLRLLGSLYEEQGQLQQALSTYRKALKVNSKDLEVRQRVVRLLQLQGELDLAIAEYRQLINSAPHNPDFVFQLVEGLLQQGRRDEALAELTKLEGRAAGDEQIQTALVDFYQRVGEEQRSLKLLEALAKRGANSPDHLIELGDRYFQAGDTEQAERTWKRLLIGATDRARALAKLGEVYLDHNLVDKALATLEEAVTLAPNEARYQKALALALERTGAGAPKSTRMDRYERALHLWERLLASGKADPVLAREARQHLITLWGLAGTLEARLAPLERNLKAEPPDLESGRLLAQMYERLKRPTQAERVLVKVTTAAPGDAQSWLALERVLAGQRKLEPAIAVLQRLVRLEPSRAREYYQRMANYAAELYHDDDAIAFASKAVELSPDDAVGHKNLADMYARRRDLERAIAEYRRAISKNDRLFPAYFDLAELLLAERQNEEADKLLRKVMRSAQDEELVTRAARLSLQLNIAGGTLESLEKELLPIALANGNKPIYRRLLIELYGALTLPLVNDAKSANVEVRTRAKSALSRIGQRAVKPLLDALADDEGNEQPIAIELLTHLANENASQALFVYATADKESKASPDLRVRAMIAAGVPAQPELLTALKGLLFERNQPRVDEADPVELAAVWGVTQIRSDAADQLLLRLLECESPTAQVLAAVALAGRKVQRAKEPLLQLYSSGEQGPLTRAALVYALGQLGAKEGLGVAERYVTDEDERVQAAALLTLTRLGGPNASTALASALTNTRPQLSRAALGALGVSVTGNYQGAEDPLAVPTGRVSAESVIDALTPPVPSAEVRARALVQIEPALSRALRLALQSTPERTRELGAALVGPKGEPSFGPLGQGLGELDPALSKPAREALARLSRDAVAGFTLLAAHPQSSIRQSALLFLSYQDDAMARKAVAEALSDADPEVQRLVLGSLAERPFAEALGPVQRLLARGGDWSLRVLALQAVAKFPALGAGSKDADAERALVAIADLAKNDGVAYVREAALRALAALDPKFARETLEHAKTHDAEPRVQKTAAELLGGSP